LAGLTGYFHGWTQEPIADVEGFTKTYAVVEFKDGNVRLVDPPTLKFVVPYRQASAAR